MRSTRRTTRATVWCTFRIIPVYRQTRFTIRHRMRTAWCWWAALIWERCLLKLSINRTRLQSNSQTHKKPMILSSLSTQLEASSQRKACIHLRTKTWKLRCLCNKHNQLSKYKRNRHNWVSNFQRCSLTTRHNYHPRYSIAKVSYQRSQWWWQFNRRIPIISIWMLLVKETKQLMTLPWPW